MRGVEDRTPGQWLDWVMQAPEGTRIPAEVVQRILEDVAYPPDPQPEAEPATWRERIWTCPDETRLLIEDVMEAMGRSRDTIYRLTRREEDPLPCRKLDGRLVFVARQVRAWMEAAEYVVVPAKPLAGLRAVR